MSLTFAVHHYAGKVKLLVDIFITGTFIDGEDFWKDVYC